MTELLFYILATESQQERFHFLARLTHQVWHKGHKVWIACDDDQKNEISEALWTFKEDSFLAHDCEERENTQILLSETSPASNAFDVWVNASNTFHTPHSSVYRVVEIIDGSEACKELARTRYREYQRLGLEPITHKL